MLKYDVDTFGDIANDDEFLVDDSPPVVHCPHCGSSETGAWERFRFVCFDCGRTFNEE